jgi:phenol hydroxylase P1 protein
MADIRTQTLEHRRETYAEVERRFGNKAGSRYQEVSYRAQPEENFHYRPLWDPQHEIYDEDYTVLRLTDPYSYSDPRQFYYTSYVAKRAEEFEAFAKNLKFIETRKLTQRLPEHWQELIVRVYTPIRHWDAAAQLIDINAARFAWGHTISQVLGLSAFDRLGNAQAHSMVALTLSGGTTETLDAAKVNWMESEELQPLRKYAEEAIVESDWAAGVIAVDLADAHLFPLFHEFVEEQVLTSGDTVIAILTEHFTTWYADQKKWLDPLIKTWVQDENHGEANAQALAAMVNARLPEAYAAAQRLAEVFDELLPVKGAVEYTKSTHEALIKRYTDLGIPL